MSKKRKLSRLILAAIPLAYNHLYQKSFGNRRSTDRMRSMPDVILPSNDFYIKEEGYAESMEEIVLPYLKTREEQGSFHTRHRISYSIFRADEPKAAVVISHGFGESVPRYYEAIYYFLHMGYDVFMPEHFGHGYSDSGVEDQTLVWVDSFDTYTDDFRFFLDHVVKKDRPNLPLVIYSHSMGGAITASCLEEYPNIADGAILSAPMFQVFLFLPESIAYPLVGTLSKTASSKSYFIGEKQTERLMEGSFELNRTSTHSKNRGSYSHHKRITSDVPPRWVVTLGWAHEAMKTTHEIVREENVKKIKVPMLMFQAGIDFYVDHKGMYEFAAYAEQLEFYKVHGSFHEIYTETDRIIVPYFNKIDKFIQGIIRKHEAT